MTTSTNSKRCKHIKANGEPCLAYAIDGDDFCFWHSDRTRAEREASAQRGGRNSRRIRHLPAAAGDVAIQTPGDVLQVLEDELNTVLQLDASLARARTVGYLLSFAMKAFELAEQHERLNEHEEQIQQLQHALAGGNNGRY